MTTAHRPTWNSAIASKDQGGNRSIVPSAAYSSRDLPAHTKLKVRQAGQNTKEEVETRDLRLELEQREGRKRKRELDDDGSAVVRAYLTAGDGDHRGSKYRKVEYDFSRDADDSDDSSYVPLPPSCYGKATAAV